MKILVLGSINIDYNYYVGHITTPKETQGASHMEVFPGGKGLNQAVTLARAGLEVQLAGQIGSDGQEMLDKLKEQLCIDISPVRVVEGRTGHAIIQVDEIGQNAIMIYGGANRTIDKAYIDDVLAQYGEGDVLVLQNEISGLQYAIDAAYEKKMFIVLNPSPCTRELLRSDLTKISMFCLNEIEGRSMTSYVQPGDILIRLAEMYPNSQFLFTLGSQGAFYKNGTRQIYQASLKVPVVASTAAGVSVRERCGGCTGICNVCFGIVCYQARRGIFFCTDNGQGRGISDESKASSELQSGTTGFGKCIIKCEKFQKVSVQGGELPCRMHFSMVY